MSSTAAAAPGFLSDVLGSGSPMVAGIVVFTAFAASCVAQVFAETVPSGRALIAGCFIMQVGMAMVALALSLSSLPWYLASAVVVGVGQGISFSRGLSIVTERSPEEGRAAVTSSYFVAASIGGSLPVLGEGMAAQHWGLRAAGIGFAIAVAVLAALCLIPVTWESRRALSP